MSYENYCLKNHKGLYKEGSWLYKIHHQPSPDWSYLNECFNMRLGNSVR